MKKTFISAFLVLLASLFYFSCGTTTSEVLISAPLRPKYVAKGYKKIYLADFGIVGQHDVDKDIRFNVNKEIKETLKSEFKDKSSYQVEDLKVAYDKTKSVEEIVKDSAFWAGQDIKDKDQSIIMAGVIDFSNHQKNGLVTERVTNPRTGVQRDVTGSRDQLQIVLGVDLYLFDAANGTKLFSENFREEQTYDDVSTVSLPLFYDVFERMAPKIVGVLVPYRVSGSRTLLEP